MFFLQRRLTKLAMVLLAFFFCENAGADQALDLRSEVQELKQIVAAQREEMDRLKADTSTKILELKEQLHSLQTARQAPPPAIPSAAQPSPAAWAETGTKKLSLLDTLLSGPQNQTGVSSIPQAPFKRSTPSGAYADPASFFFLHGYTTLTYADFGKDFGGVPGQNSQILVEGISSRSGKHESGFRNDTALIIGSQLSESLEGVFEVHFVGNALDPVVTEGKITWEPFETSSDEPSLRLVAGRYWWPFGIHNFEWFSSVNSFNLLSPAALEAVPVHYTEVGVMAEGEWPISKNFGFNYLFSIGNGVSSFEIGDNTGSGNAFDLDSNRTFTARIGVFPWIENLEIGASFAAGGLRRGLDTSFAVSDARRYEADLTAFGVDAVYRWKDLDFRGYWYFSEEDFTGAPLDTLDRNGGTLEMLYTLLKDAPLVKEVRLKGRVSTVIDATLSDGSFRSTQYGLGFNLRPRPHFLIKTEYFIQDEGRGISGVDNDGFNLSGTVEF